jgi:hypothetical protein
MVIDSLRSFRPRRSRRMQLRPCPSVPRVPGRKHLRRVANSAVGRRNRRRVARGEKSDSIALLSASAHDRSRADSPRGRARVQGAQAGTHAPEPEPAPPSFEQDSIASDPGSGQRFRKPDQEFPDQNPTISLRSLFRLSTPLHLYSPRPWNPLRQMISMMRRRSFDNFSRFVSPRRPPSAATSSSSCPQRSPPLRLAAAVVVVG